MGVPLSSGGRYVLLLRAINLGARNKVPMPRLREICHDLGCARVRTYVQSGNVVVDTELGARDLARALEAALEGEFGFRPQVITRTLGEMEGARAAFPFPVTDPKLAAVGFLAAEPDPSWSDRLPAAADVEPDRYTVLGREVHISYSRERGQHGSKLSGQRFERAFGVAVTVRNLRTVEAIIDVASEP